MEYKNSLYFEHEHNAGTTLFTRPISINCQEKLDILNSLKYGEFIVVISSIFMLVKKIFVVRYFVPITTGNDERNKIVLRRKQSTFV